jgi:hypothetical protein
VVAGVKQTQGEVLIVIRNPLTSRPSYKVVLGYERWLLNMLLIYARSLISVYTT